MPTIPVKVRLAQGTYHAKVDGKPFKCTCTSGDDNAAVALAGKYYGPRARVQRVEHRHDIYRHSDVENAFLADREARELLAQGITHLIQVP